MPGVGGYEVLGDGLLVARVNVRLPSRGYARAVWGADGRAAGCGAALYDGTAPTSETSDDLARLGRYSKNGSTTAVVGSYEKNDWGIYDTLGNVFEICLDYYASDNTQCDPNVGPTTGTDRVSRGGAFDNDARFCRCAFRTNKGPSAQSKSAGCRLACSVVIPD